MPADPSVQDRQVQGLDALEMAPPRRSDRPAAVRVAARAWAATWPKLAAVAIVLVAWQAVVWSGWRPVYVLPGPDQVLPRLFTEVASAEFWEAFRVTMRRALTGFALALTVGVLLGLAVTRFRLLRVAIGSLITGLQTMPSIVWFPFAMLLYGISESAIMFVIVLGAAPSIAGGLTSGIDYVSPQLMRAGQAMGLRGVQRYTLLIVPAALPMFVSGLKQGWAFAWRSLMAGELLVIINQQNSIGWALSQARQFNDSEGLLAYVLIVLCVGIVIDVFFNWADRSIRRRWGVSAS
ncbi:MULTISPECIES: ABC transporter permease [Nocardiopsis]|uniref:ABC transporter permease n=1 Tax=Nocardiopsis sinuspersici TaxID=501010 RepID=A0A1V3BZ26_9ACTN|nr:MULTISPECIES: ABC transporter permease [Nocardiopsis]NYH54593.1 NitT/TauT family transport system permease protein [Nocardiopsis sinuspersici]OOC53390.1 ABC transporter permease [Nocardiopsis sinuspersici]